LQALVAILPFKPSQNENEKEKEKEKEALKEGDGEGMGEVEALRVHDGLLIESTGFNSFPVEKNENGEEVLVADIGCLIDYRFQRKGYALECLEKVIEYGFGELGV
jgi:RimJ/RimL family protein N-acetyltransferase